MDPAPGENLLVDHASAPTPADADVQTWAAGQSVFVSSVITGMREERRAALRGITAVGAQPVLFETFGGMDDDPEDAYLNNVAAAQIYIGVLGERYGKPLKSGYSATHAEYNEAVDRGLRLSVWATEGDLDGRQRDFLEEIRVFRTTGSYASPGALADGVQRRLRVIAAESLAPWAKVGNAILRATSIRDDGKQITVAARIRDNTVAANLEAHRPGAYGRQTDTRITWPGGTSAARVTEVASETDATGARIITIVAVRIDDSARGTIDMSIEDRSPEDLTELAMRIALLGEANPLGSMSFMIEIENPLSGLDDLRLSEDSTEQVAKLLVTELLVGVRGVDHITSFRLGPKRLDRRRLAVGWMPRRRYINEEPVGRYIEGEVAARS